MYCPKCGADNRKHQQYCPNCGTSLKSVNLALSGKVEEASELLTKYYGRLTGGIVTVLIFMVIALISSFFDKGSAIINLLLGLAIGGPMIISGLKRVGQAVSIFSPKDAAMIGNDPSPKGLPSGDQASLPVAGSDDANAVPGSIAEPTTARLKIPVG